MKIGYWSPMPPAPTGVADYSAALLPYLAALGEVVVNAPGDVNIYHTGNNALHREIYARALAEPGVVVLHDAVLQHFFLGSLDEAAYVEEFVYNYGEWARGEAKEMWRERARSGADARYFARPDGTRAMLKRLLERAHSVIVHNPAASVIVRQHVPDARVFEIPHLFFAPPKVDAAELRTRLSPDNALVVGSFGHQRETKRLNVLVRAFELARARGAHARLIVTGEFVSDTFEKAMRPLLDRVEAYRAGHLAEPAFWQHLAATDLCVNLRYPSAAETSGVAIRMLGLGKVVAFTRDAATSRYPENACLRIDVGPAEEEMLANYIVWLAEHRDAVAAMGRNAARYIAQQHAPEKAARLYWEAAQASARV